jgi:hypothetical protein
VQVCGGMGNFQFFFAIFFLFSHCAEENRKRRYIKLQTDD